MTEESHTCLKCKLHCSLSKLAVHLYSMHLLGCLGRLPRPTQQTSWCHGILVVSLQSFAQRLQPAQLAWALHPRRPQELKPRGKGQGIHRSQAKRLNKTNPPAPPTCGARASPSHPNAQVKLPGPERWGGPSSQAVEASFSFSFSVPSPCSRPGDGLLLS